MACYGLCNGRFLRYAEDLSRHVFKCHVDTAIISELYWSFSTYEEACQDSDRASEHTRVFWQPIRHEDWEDCASTRAESRRMKEVLLYGMEYSNAIILP
jgi:hypothetical protein